MLRITLITIFTCSVFILSGCSGGSDGNDNSSSVDQSNMNNENSMSGPFSGAPDGDLASIENLAATPGVGNSVYDNIFNNPDLTNFREAIDAAGLASTLDNEEQPFTVFAPVNSAFTAFALSNLGVDLTPIVNNHISPGLRSISNLNNMESEISQINVDDFLGNGPNGEPLFATADDVRLVTGAFTTLLGESMFTVISDTAPTGVAVNTPILNPSDSIDVIIGDSNFDPGTSAGVVHIIDGVLIPRQ